MSVYLALAALAFVVCAIGGLRHASKQADSELHRDLEDERERTKRVTALREARKRLS